MSLPHPGLNPAIASLAEDFQAGGLKQAAEALSVRYRAEGGPGFSTEAERMAYLLMRMPATEAALRQALAWSLEALPDFQPRSMLDLGAGPGTAAWAAFGLGLELESIELLEQDSRMIALGRRLLKLARIETPAPRWRHESLEPGRTLPESDLLVASYVFTEWGRFDAARWAERLIRSARRAILVVEPGTPMGFSRIRALREALRALGWQPAAPCPHSGECPMRGLPTSEPWCHFAVRVARARRHRQLKSGSLGWEDEKFSYLTMVAPDLIPVRQGGRILDRPGVARHRVTLRLCAPAGLEDRPVNRGDAVKFRAARKAAWGDAWPHPGAQKPG